MSGASHGSAGDRPVDTTTTATLHHRIRSADAACDLLALAAARPSRYPFLLESSAGAAAQSRFDLLLAFPGETITADDSDGDFFAALDVALAAEHSDGVPGLPFIGGWFVYLGYETAATVEPRLSLPPSPVSALPDAFAVRCPAAILRDRRDDRLHLLAEPGHGDCIAAMQADLDAAADRPAPAADTLAADWQEADPAAYIAQVAAARDYIHAGDIFQANLSRAWHGRLRQPSAPATVQAALRAANPAPFSGLIQWRGEALACSSPERLLLVDDGVAQTRPIAGTRPRTPGSDDLMTRELLDHPKERAEHVMLIDLERNDLGRVCEPGSIRVDELMVAESYAHVHHIVSNIRGRMRAGVGPGAVLRAVFPGGTITGCPKVRCMEIIAELEGEGRGAYTGAFGYLSRCGRLDTNIVIRSLSMRERELTLRTGAGIVADSVPEQELEETRIKARGVLRSFRDADGVPYG
ncbi:hypothetical protein SAOR_10975 [Salinisphaera orenii MK-B5]|uniref:Anthranilate synthase n=1 Tax=Salinisphaera orenii MK-B5 TaxID=856730 RepID=A0A423PKU9_9GAMM|nr:hypothetical protein SAOR_10975 [Salinisphaera orenii MK-B5]